MHKGFGYENTNQPQSALSALSTNHKEYEMNIKQIIEQHALWLDTGGKEGSRANLTHANLVCVNLTRANLTRANLAFANLDSVNLHGANLTHVNLEGANLFSANLDWANLNGANLTHVNLTHANLDSVNLDGASGNLNNIKSVFCDTHPVTYTAEVMQIGCQCHKLEDWWSFDDARIIEMDGKTALNWWRTWKPILQQIIATSPANATEYVENKDATAAAKAMLPIKGEEA